MGVMGVGVGGQLQCAQPILAHTLFHVLVHVCPPHPLTLQGGTELKCSVYDMHLRTAIHQYLPVALSGDSHLMWLGINPNPIILLHCPRHLHCPGNARRAVRGHHRVPPGPY